MSKMLTQTHSKEYTQDSSVLARRKKFLSLVSCSLREVRPPIKSVADLKRQAMGHKPTQSFCEAKGITLRIKRSSNLQSQNTEVKRKMPNLVDISDYAPPSSNPTSDYHNRLNGSNTPINRLLVDFHYKENIPF